MVRRHKGNLILELKDIAELALNHAKKMGATEVELSLSRGKGLDVNVYQGDVDKVEYQNDQAFSITIYRDQQKGSASTTNLAQDNILRVIGAASDIAKISAKDEFSGLPDKSLIAKTAVELDLFHPWDIATEQAIDLAKNLEAKGMAFDKRIVNSDGVSVSTQRTHSLYANSQDFVGETKKTRHDLTCVLVASEKDKMERDYYYDLKCDAKDLMSIDEIAKRAAESVVMRLNPRKIKTCQAPVIFSAELSRGLIRQFISAISGTPLYRKASFMVDKLGENVFAKHISLREKPLIKKALSSAWFDSDGVTTSEKNFIQDGKLTSYCLGNYSAKRLGMQTTGNAGGVHNLYVESSQGVDNNLLNTMHKGLLVTDLLGHGANIVTGDYSTGACGYWVENGEIQYPVAEITVASTLQDIFYRLLALGDDIDNRGNVHTGSMLFEEMTIAGG